jgi:hypothetical protein
VRSVTVAKDQTDSTTTNMAIKPSYQSLLNNSDEQQATRDKKGTTLIDNWKF